jgi:hypothetical protein
MASAGDEAEDGEVGDTKTGLDDDSFVPTCQLEEVETGLAAARAGSRVAEARHTGRVGGACPSADGTPLGWTGHLWDAVGC